ncbi:chemotaxis protein CheW, partial [Pseudomonas sp. SIMBA_059]
MNDLPPHAASAHNAKGALYLQFRLREQRFALSVHEVIEVLPRQPLKPIAQAPAWVAGILAHRGHLVPVIDLGA